MLDYRNNMVSYPAHARMADVVYSLSRVAASLPLPVVGATRRRDDERHALLTAAKAALKGKRG